MQWPWGRDQTSSSPRPPADADPVTQPTTTALVSFESAPGRLPDTRPPVDPRQIGYPFADPAEAERTAQLRERVAVLETQLGALSAKSTAHDTSIGDVEGFHKTVKITASVVAVILVAAGSLLGLLGFLFPDEIRTVRKMAAEYQYCQEHRDDKDGADCIVRPAPTEGAKTGATGKGGR